MLVAKQDEEDFFRKELNERPELKYGRLCKGTSTVLFFLLAVAVR